LIAFENACYTNGVITAERVVSVLRKIALYSHFPGIGMRGGSLRGGFATKIANT